jgi:hypothetical protein
VRASATSRKREPFKEGTALNYRVTYDEEQFALLKDGLIPHEMEDKWFIYYEEPYLYFHRSWTGLPVYRVTLKSLPTGGAQVIEALWSKGPTFPDAATRDSEYPAKLLDFLITSLLLRQSKSFPMPSGFGDHAPGLLQHVISGTGFPQSSDSKLEDSTSSKPEKKKAK